MMKYILETIREHEKKKKIWSSLVVCNNMKPNLTSMKGTLSYFDMFIIFLIIYINSLHLSVCLFVSQSDGGFGGWGRERLVKQWTTGVNLWQGLDHHSFREQTVPTKHCSRPKGRNDGRIASLSHHTRSGYKNLPLPPPPPIIERTGGYIEERVFEKFQNFHEPRFKMSESGFWVFSRQVRE
jgi:hypothetical protein